MKRKIPYRVPIYFRYPMMQPNWFYAALKLERLG
jgi:hypothetical protein